MTVELLHNSTNERVPLTSGALAVTENPSQRNAPGRGRSY